MAKVSERASSTQVHSRGDKGYGLDIGRKTCSAAYRTQDVFSRVGGMRRHRSSAVKSRPR